MLEIFRSAFPDLQKTTENIFAAGDEVVDRVTVRGTQSGPFMSVPPTGKLVTITEMHIARVAGGSIVERWGNGINSAC